MMDKVNQTVLVGKSARVHDEPVARKLKSPAEAESSEFGGELLQAQALAQLSAQPSAASLSSGFSSGFDVSLSGAKTGAQAALDPATAGVEDGERPRTVPGPVPGTKGDPRVEAGRNATLLAEQSLKPGQLMPDASKGQGVAANASRDGAGKAPLSMIAAASSNTAAAIAGLKPWSRDWILDGEISNQPDPNAYFASKPEANAGSLQEVARMMENSRSRGEAEDVGTQKAQVQNPLMDSGATPGSARHDLVFGSWGGDLSRMGKTEPFSHRAGSSPSGSMAGSEFLSTLSAVRGGVAGAQGSKSGSSGNGAFENGANSFGANAELSSGSASKPLGSRAKKPAFEMDGLGLSQATQGDLRGFGAEHRGLNMPMGSVAQAGHPVEVTGHVVKGAMSQDRLSSEALGGISTGIRGLFSRGGGEMRVRLRPDHLGELNIHITTQGNQVGLRIQASDEQAKKVLEESIGHLKESMAGHHLELGQIDLTVARAGSGAGLGGEGMNDPAQRGHQQSYPGLDQGGAFGGFNDPTGQGRGFSGNGEWGRQSYDQAAAGDTNRPNGPTRPGLGGIGRARTAGAAASGRLDVRA